MLANGPAWTKTGVPSKVCIRLGLMASFIKTVNAPATPRSSEVIGFPSKSEPMTICPRRFLISSKLVVKAKIAMISLATAMSNLKQENSHNDIANHK